MANLINESEIRSTWAPIIESATGINDANKLAWMSTYCHNHKLYEDANIMRLDPSMNLTGMGAAAFPVIGGANGSGDKAPSLLPLAMQVAAQTIGLDLVPVVPMAGPMGLLSYLDFTYEGGRLDNSVTPTYVKTSSAKAGNDVLVGTSRIDGLNIIKVVDALSVVVGSEEASIADRYTTPVLVKALEDHIKGFAASNDAGAPYSREAGERTADKVMGLSLFSKSIAAETFQVAAAVTREQVQDLKQFGVDAVAQVESVLTNELTQSINQHILGSVRTLGTTNVTATFGTATDFDIALANASALSGGETVASEHRKVLTQVLAAANLIANRGRRGAGNFAVVGAQVATILQSISGFVANPMANTISQSAGAIYPLGSVAGINVYTDPTQDWGSYKISVGRKGDGNGPGLVFMPYLMAESVQTIAEGTMAPKIAVKSRFALVEAGFHAETQYVTFSITNGSGSWTNLINLA
tara:strand:+ start:287 stop:1693 length:1407 start_codon:yes stop_codon:yes gene_type:complete